MFPSRDVCKPTEETIDLRLLDKFWGAIPFCVGETLACAHTVIGIKANAGNDIHALKVQCSVVSARMIGRMNLLDGTDNEVRTVDS
jgi:hypothetical protein